MSTLLSSTEAAVLAGARIALVGRLAGMSKRDAAQLIRQQGGIIVDLQSETTADRNLQLIVVGEDVALSAEPGSASLFDETTQAAIDSGQIEVIGESEFWQRLGLVDGQERVRRLYTPAMLAELLGRAGGHCAALASSRFNSTGSRSAPPSLFRFSGSGLGPPVGGNVSRRNFPRPPSNANWPSWRATFPAPVGRWLSFLSLCGAAACCFAKEMA